MSTTSESRTGSDSRQQNSPGSADFRACSDAIEFLRHLMTRGSIGRAIRGSQVFAHLRRLREVLNGRSASEVPITAISALNACRQHLRAAVTAKKRRMKGRMQHIGKAQQQLGAAQAFLTERRTRCGAIWVLAIIEIVEIRIAAPPQQHRKSGGKRKGGRRRRRPYFDQRGSQNGDGHPS